MTNPKKSFFATTVIMLLALMLVACGETATSPANTTSMPTTNVTAVITTTSSITTAQASGPTAMAAGTATIAETTNGVLPNVTSIVGTANIASTVVVGTANSAATVVVGTANKVGTAAANTPAVPGTGGAAGTLNLPAIPNTSEIKLTQDTAQQILKAASLPASLTNATVRIFVSDEDPAKLATDADTAFIGGGYAFAIPGQSKPLAQGNNTFGIYSKSGSLDVLTVVTDPAKAFASGTSAAGVQDIENQLKGKKSALIVVGANGMLQAIAGGQAAGAGSTAPTAAPTK